MDSKEKRDLIFKYEDKILVMFDNQIENLMPRGDLQGCLEAMLSNVIEEGRKIK